jgi:hypothetical protein
MDSSFNNIQHIIQDRQGMAFLAVFVAGFIFAASPCVLAAIRLSSAMWRLLGRKREKSGPLFARLHFRSFHHLHALGRGSITHGRVLRFHGQGALYRASSHRRNHGTPTHWPHLAPAAFSENEAVKVSGPMGRIPPRPSDWHRLVAMRNSCACRDPRLCLDAG